MNYNETAEKILHAVGGAENIRMLTHCATRLRMEFNDRAQVNDAQIGTIPGVISVVEKGGQFQIVIGNEVQQVYRLLNKALPEKKNPAGGDKNAKPAGIVARIISVISTTFTPVIPAITGAGMIKALLAILKLTGAISETSSTWQLLNIIADAAFFFLPVLLAYGASLKFECNPILAMTLAGVLLHPGIGQMLAAGKAVDFVGINVLLSDYAGSVLPIILTVWLMSWVERFAEKVSPSIIKFFIKPMLILLITAPLALVVVGPAGILLNDLVAAGAGAIDRHASWLIPMLMGTLQPFLIITGTAWAMTPIATGQLSKNGFEMINGPGMLASNVAMGAATLCVALKTKNSNLRQLASSSGFTALLGITEPALYGVLLKFRRVMIAAMIGGGCAGMYAGFSGLVRYAFVSPGLAALPAFIGENPMNIVHALVTCAISIVVTFTLTWFIAFKDASEEQDAAEPTPPPVISPKNDGDIEVLSPLRGQVVPLSDVNDDVFASGLLGQGVAIRPQEGCLKAPFNGKVMMFLPSCHAVGLQSESGLELLVHIGIDTVNLNGQHFSSSLKVGDVVEAGQELIRFDIAAIERAGYDVITPVVVVNGDEHCQLSVTAATQVNYGESLMVQSAKEAQA
ncbi:PTS system beta-glucoside-specific IIA component (Glc family) /PTS system beta-glucoside-specific IIB component (Glc family) /PTS system beta-glucoside-specific IIC component (Glc family) [Raoultella sp. BIGb0399]|uniref:beta-glucoside-specific PTS transporter subunit IIABC n=1 Tax=Raoultella sp. BIGb0399 TaxID=2485119 RepID=UPI000F4BD141|nr:beta-glucoside-specific PTS transporter subunit IIABC [Raoultella sp. BIGb0399]ROS13633.1 PTS system beta-glucoside-specific IIA component (Glc family) /PTS system beta-glucoside-specific IIB component (Glc family) /PTS system beta-glucoside-specific IIC component (Glc family) [Raoultella sp. BIGb0399]